MKQRALYISARPLSIRILNSATDAPPIAQAQCGVLGNALVVHVAVKKTPRLSEPGFEWALCEQHLADSQDLEPSHLADGSFQRQPLPAYPTADCLRSTLK